MAGRDQHGRGRVPQSTTTCQSYKPHACTQWVPPHARYRGGCTAETQQTTIPGPPTSPQTVCATPHSSWSLSEMKNSFVLGIMHTCPFLHAHQDWNTGKSHTVQSMISQGQCMEASLCHSAPLGRGHGSKPAEAALQKAIGGPCGALRRGLLAPVEPAVWAAAPLCQGVHQADRLRR